MKSNRKLNSIFIILLIVVIISIGQILIKKGMNLIEINGLSSILNIPILITIFTNMYVLVGIILYAIALLFLLGVMGREDVSFVYPLLSIGYIITAIFAISILGETVSVYRWLGIGFIILGSFFIGRS